MHVQIVAVIPSLGQTSFVKVGKKYQSSCQGVSWNVIFCQNNIPTHSLGFFGEDEFAKKRDAN
jgi:hypothetical protein